MTITDFSRLKTNEQLGLLYSDGIYLSKRKSERMTVLLYQFQNVYVEIFYITYRRVVHHIGFSESADILDPYLESIPIGDIFEAD